MIKIEYFTTRADGVVLNRTYSDLNHYIERDGVLYTEAIDPQDSGRVYTETEMEIITPMEGGDADGANR